MASNVDVQSIATSIIPNDPPFREKEAYGVDAGDIATLSMNSDRPDQQPIDGYLLNNVETETRDTLNQSTTALRVNENSALQATMNIIAARQSDKQQQIANHPLVEWVTNDGCCIQCKCGKSVRLNPAWYILKFEQHIVSRNCTYLRSKKRPHNDQALQLDQQTRPYRLLNIHELRLIPRENTEELRIQEQLATLESNPYFHRITPDGRFIECSCLALLIMTQPWDLNVFHRHIAAKKMPVCEKPKLKRRKEVSIPETLLSEELQTSSNSMEEEQSNRQPKKHRVGAGATFRVEQRMNFRDGRWEPVSLRNILPCPGLRADERIQVYINSAPRITGGSRSREKIAEELFPHLFAQPQSSSTKSRPRLSASEKQLVYDAMESEATWFVDRDGNSVRSLDCKGEINIRKGERLCALCADLRVNSRFRTNVTMATHKKNKSEQHQQVSLQHFKSSVGNQSASKKSSHSFVLLEKEFDMIEEYARILRDLFAADVEDGSVKNVWFDIAEMGIMGQFDNLPVFVALLEAMVELKNRERRGVGRQNMMYSSHLDQFMKTMSKLSVEACDFFQLHLGGRKQKYLLQPTSSSTIKHTLQDSSLTTTEKSAQDDEGLRQLLNLSNTHPSLADHHIPEVAYDGEAVLSLSTVVNTHSNQDSETNDNDGRIFEIGTSELDISGQDSCLDSSTPPVSVSGVVPCQGLRDGKITAYVINAVQIIGGSRPKHIIVKELFPSIFENATKVKILEKLNEEQRYILQDAVFSECLWRVDKQGNCVRSLRCHRLVHTTQSSESVCRACLSLKRITNFRSVLSRAQVPKKVENLKYVPSVYTESDPFMRKLSKNASLRALYQSIRSIIHHEPTPEQIKKITFWVRFAKMGLFGGFRSHTVFEGLIASMVDIQDKLRRGVGKQNMQYTKALDEFMSTLATISLEAFELFTVHFCGRTTRSQKVKKRKVLQSATLLSSVETGFSSSIDETLVQQMGLSSDSSHGLLTAEDLLAARPMSTADMEESQRFMDRMLNEVNLSVNHSEMIEKEQSDQDNMEHVNHLDTQTFLDENGVLTTVL